MVNKNYRELLIPSLLFALALLSYGWQLIAPGFFWDDWGLVYMFRLHDVAELNRYLAFDRPLSAWPYLMTAPIFGVNAFLWQIAALLMRWASALGFWLVLKNLWKNHDVEAAGTAALFLVFPGFSQQPVSVIYFLVFLCYTLFNLSIYLMIRSLADRRRFWIWMPLSFVLGLLQLLTIEYYAGLELLRPIILWIALLNSGERKKEILRKTFLHWLPYLLALAAFFLYRFVFFSTASSDPQANAPLLLQQFAANPVARLGSLLQKVLQDALYCLLFAWQQPIQISQIDFSARTGILALGVGLVAGLILLLALRRTMKISPTDQKEAEKSTQNGCPLCLTNLLPIQPIRLIIITPIPNLLLMKKRAGWK